MSGEVLAPIEAEVIYNVLVAHAGEVEREYDRADFIRHQVRGCVEYRFMGSLGFGGKFWNNGGWYVSCYPEDKTPERDAAIKTTNAALAELYAISRAIDVQASR